MTEVRGPGLRRMLLCMAAAWLATACAGSETGPARIYLVRHAEKADSSEDAELSAAGAHRARRLAEALGDRGITSIWSSDFRRTRSTAAPLAEALQLPIRIYDPRAAGDFAGRLVDEGRSALVVGHSNTIPGLAALLCSCEVGPMRYSDYDRLYVIILDRHRRSLSELGMEAFIRASAQP